MANYSSKYIRDFATLTAPLQELTRKDVRFDWTPTHQEAFEKLINALSSAPCMSYFDKNKQTFVTVDASPVGISAILSQKSKNSDMNSQKIIACPSRALSDTEKRYSQTEKEALAIIWAVEHFHLFIYGSKFTLVTDHKPLEITYGQRTAKTSARIERWVFRLQPYAFKIVYKSGTNNPADYLSRHPTNESKHKQEKMTEQYINFVTQISIPKAMSLNETIQAINADAALTELKDAIKTNKWDSPAVKPFKPVKNELTTTTQGVILRGTRIVVPTTLQQRVINLAHEAHLGIEKTKRFVKEKIWFPQIDTMIQNTIEQCVTCQAVYSRFPDVEIVHSIKASAVIPKLDKIFAVHGIPKILNSDNGPPFNGEECKRYLNTLGITPEFSTPPWPQGNSSVERFMQPLGKALKTAKIEGRPWKQELNRFLLQYRTTPHTTTGFPPAELLFNRTVQGKLPVLQRKTLPIDTEKHERMKRSDKCTIKRTRIIEEMQRKAESKSETMY